MFLLIHFASQYIVTDRERRRVYEAESVVECEWWSASAGGPHNSFAVKSQVKRQAPVRPKWRACVITGHGNCVKKCGRMDVLSEIDIFSSKLKLHFR